MRVFYSLGLMFIVITSILLMSCSRSSNTLVVSTDTGFDKHTVYMAGYYLDSNKIERAAYWVNGKMTLLENYNSVATGIYVDGTDIYVSGYTYSIGLRNSRDYSAVYWKNGVRISLSTLYPQSIGGMLSYGIFVSKGDIYIVGEDRGHATIWKNNLPFTLETKSSVAKSIYISGNDIYVAGLIWKTTACCSIRMATLWKNNIPTSIGLGDSEAFSVFVKDNDVFVGGYDDPNPFGIGGHFQSATYWKNGNLVRLDSLNVSNVSAIAFDGKDLYAAGHTALWKNKVPVFFNPGGSTYCNSIFLIDGESFVAGSSVGGLNTGAATVTLWHNNNQFNLPFYGAANSIFVK